MKALGAIESVKRIDMSGALGGDLSPMGEYTRRKTPLPALRIHDMGWHVTVHVPPGMAVSTTDSERPLSHVRVQKQYGPVQAEVLFRDVASYQEPRQPSSTPEAEKSAPAPKTSGCGPDLMQVQARATRKRKAPMP